MIRIKFPELLIVCAICVTVAKSKSILEDNYVVTEGACRNENDRFNDIFSKLGMPTLAECKNMCDNTVGCGAVSYSEGKTMCFGTSMKYSTKIENDWKCYSKSAIPNTKPYHTEEDVEQKRNMPTFEKRGHDSSTAESPNEASNTIEHSAVINLSDNVSQKEFGLNKMLKLSGIDSYSFNDFRSITEGGLDFDNDGINDSMDNDDDNDGIPDALDEDDDNDGIPDDDDDNDGIPDALDEDDDNDGIPDDDDDNDGIPDEEYNDFDNDGIPDALDNDDDNDGIPDDLDDDDDNDGILDQLDTDGDGVPDVEDPDIDGDGILNVDDADDDGDGIRDEDDNTGVGCIDTADWEDNFGGTCETWTSKKWCYNGGVSILARAGRYYNNPEHNCCACGKGDYEITGDTQCYPTYNFYSNFKDAETACNNDSNCSYVYAGSCDIYEFNLCAKDSSIMSSNMGSCILVKPGVETPRIETKFEGFFKILSYLPIPKIVLTSTAAFVEMF